MRVVGVEFNDAGSCLRKYGWDQKSFEEGVEDQYWISVQHSTEQVDNISAIKKDNPHENYQKSMNVFMSYDEQRRNRMAKEILSKSANKTFLQNSKLNRDIFDMAIRVLKKSGSLYGKKENTRILYRIFLSNPDFTGSGFYYDLYEMNKPKDIHIDELRTELISGRARILELAIHWDITGLEGVTKKILQDESSNWGTKEVHTVDGIQRKVRRIRIYPSRVFKKHDRCAEIGDANIPPSVDVDVVDLAKAYLGWVGNKEYIAELERAFFNAKQSDDSEKSDSYEVQIYYYSLLYLIGHPPAKRPRSENDTGVVIPGIGPISIE